MPEVLVVGAGAAGLATADALRRRGFPGPITILGAESHLPYDRPPLSNQVLAGEWEPDRARLRPVEAVVLATGAHPRRLPGALDAYALRSLDDAVALRAALGPGRRLVVVGDGVLGTEIAATAAKPGADVTLAGPQPAPMHPQLGPVAADILGAGRAYTPTPYFWTQQFDARIHLYGLPGEDFEVLEGDPGAGRFVAAYRRGGQPVGVLGWNMPKQAPLHQSVLSFEEGKNGDDLSDDQGEGLPVRSAARAG